MDKVQLLEVLLSARVHQPYERQSVFTFDYQVNATPKWCSRYHLESSVMRVRVGDFGRKRPGKLAEAVWRALYGTRTCEGRARTCCWRCTGISHRFQHTAVPMIFENGVGMRSLVLFLLENTTCPRASTPWKVVRLSVAQRIWTHKGNNSHCPQILPIRRSKCLRDSNKGMDEVQG